jgi:hypothetical protein
MLAGIEPDVTGSVLGHAEIFGRNSRGVSLPKFKQA